MTENSKGMVSCPVFEFFIYIVECGTWVRDPGAGATGGDSHIGYERGKTRD